MPAEVSHQLLFFVGTALIVISLPRTLVHLLQQPLCVQREYFVVLSISSFYMSLVLEESCFLVGPFPSLLSVGGSLVPLVCVDQSTADPPHARGPLTLGTQGASAQIWDVNKYMPGTAPAKEGML